MATEIAVEELIASLGDLEKLASDRKLFAILDRCDAPDIQERLRSLPGEEVACLFRGPLTPEVEKTAPSLARVDRDLLTWLIDAVWKEPWGIFVVAGGELEQLLRHLRKFLLVKNPENETVYFRYYDPRVLPVFLKACNQEEIKEFCGPILAFGCAGTSPGQASLLRPL